MSEQPTAAKPMPSTYVSPGVRIDPVSGKPILRVMKVLRPAVYESAAMEKAFEIGRAAHEQIEAKYGPRIQKEYTITTDRGDYIIECHADLYNPEYDGLVMEIKSWKYFVEEYQACIWQLSAYKALLHARHAWFILYEGEFDKKVELNKDKTATTLIEKFKVKSKSQAFVPLMDDADILVLLDEKAHELLAKLRAEGKLP